MQEVFEKIIEILENEAHEAEKDMQLSESYADAQTFGGKQDGYENAIKIVKQEAEKYNNGWISCREHQPEEAGTYNVTAHDGRKLRSTHAKWQPRLKSWNLTGTMAYWKVIAWQPLPQPYQPKGE